METQKKPQKKRGRGRSVESMYLDAVTDMENFDLTKSDDASISKMKFLQTRVTTLADLLAAKRRDKVKEVTDELDKALAENAELKAKVGVIPQEFAEKLSTVEAENQDLRRKLLHQPVKVTTVIQADPKVAAERDALKVVVNYLSVFSGFDAFRKIEAVIELFASNPTSAKALAEVFRVSFEDIKALMAKSSSELQTFKNAYRSAHSDIALAIIAFRTKENSKKEKNMRELAVEATPIPPSDEELAARKRIEQTYSPEVLAIRERSVLAEVERSKEPHRGPTSPSIVAIQAEIQFAQDLEWQKKALDPEYESDFERQKRVLDEQIAKLLAQQTGEDIT